MLKRFYSAQRLNCIQPYKISLGECGIIVMCFLLFVRHILLWPTTKHDYSDLSVEARLCLYQRILWALLKVRPSQGFIRVLSTIPSVLPSSSLLLPSSSLLLHSSSLLPPSSSVLPRNPPLPLLQVTLMDWMLLMTQVPWRAHLMMSWLPC